MSITDRSNVPRGERQSERPNRGGKEEFIPATSFFITVTRVRQKKKRKKGEGEDEEREKKGAKINRTRKSTKAKNEFLVSGGREIWA